MIITVTGRSGCGKSTLALMLSVKLNLPLIDVDEIVEGMYSDPNMQNTLKTAFGDVVEGPDGKVEKRLVSKIVLNNRDHWDTLNYLTWNYLEKKIDEKLAENNNNAIIDYKFIPVTKYFELSDYNILVEAKNDKVRTKKLIKRDKIDKYVVQKRDNFSPNYKRHEFNYVVLNTYNKDFAVVCESLIRQIKEDIESKNE